MLVILKGNTVAVLLSACCLLEHFSPFQIKIIIEGYYPPRQDKDKRWVITPVSSKFQVLEDAMFQRKESSLMFLEGVGRTESGELVAKPGVHYDKCALFDQTSLEVWLWKLLVNDRRVHFVQKVGSQADEYHGDTVILETHTQVRNLINKSRTRDDSLQSVRWLGVDNGLRLPHKVKLSPRKKLQIEQKNGIIKSVCDDQLACAMDTAMYMKSVVDQQVSAMRWASL
ncbi:unnamed protein product [Cyberlindnera jadinii]|uniref:Uncharacterized protein n=1 Tax=Cyberlindnera jadinii (strain ATCC 18201 / CBS 1600 / BCRC 20928 / JCM 3617 / NBRC 0987 / NRRL Y-1542) TaxID=983966 RepID=A0A0H5C035_CYBJN|nr:hypothetical protein CYBJADRAFT_165746 [Cyberlindnera jadinii NRRL Y-1542]ODV76467.1 hypothetical protein CYBJADRAFT_165746 [Cyberlindnera jadinii NRRL Y-1542]CEP21093.1 unnamed protein product [Cyberlindnera jadinii]